MSSREVLESFYGTSIVWFEDPRDEKARERFELIAAYASRLLDSRLEELVKGRKSISVLDVAGGTGIAGVAFAKALASRGLHVRLTVVDARDTALQRLTEWLDHAGLRGFVEAESLSGDVRRLPGILECCFDLALLWGSSLPHFSPWGLILVASGIAELQPQHGVFLVEQRDILPGILFNNLYERIHIARLLPDGRGVVAIHLGYDKFLGAEKKAYYTLPGYNYVATLNTRLWDIASAAAILWLFYTNIELGEQGPKQTEVIIASRPRQNTPRNHELWSSLPKQLSQETS